MHFQKPITSLWMEGEMKAQLAPRFEIRQRGSLLRVPFTSTNCPGNQQTRSPTPPPSPSPPPTAPPSTAAGADAIGGARTAVAAAALFPNLLFPPLPSAATAAEKDLVLIPSSSIPLPLLLLVLLVLLLLFLPLAGSSIPASRLCIVNNPCRTCSKLRGSNGTSPAPGGPPLPTNPAAAAAMPAA